MDKNYVVYHLHSDLSNADGFADSCTSYKDYIKLAKKQGMKAIAFSEHGNIYEWIKKKQECDKVGIKYIHGVEHYLCQNLSTNTRGTHIGLYAKNWDGVCELNKLVTISSSKGIKEDNSDRHMYYNRRISLEELMNTSDNIIITSACLASPINKWNNEEDREFLKNLIKWMNNNKHRCFLEIQYHNCESQIKYNKMLYQLSIKTGIPLIAGTDTHSSNKYKAECRKILQKYKKSYYGEEDEFDLTWKTYDELINEFEIQNSLPKEVYLEAINNTNKLADMIEEFSLDKSLKYPILYGEDVNNQWKQLIYKCFNEKLINNKLKLPSLVKKKCEKYFELHNNTDSDDVIYENYKKEYEWSLSKTDEEVIQLYKIKIKEEFKVMSKLGMESFMMFMSELITWANNNNISCGAGRGSVCGSIIAYITNITDVDPIVWGTVFSRFCNEDRISLGDIDVDFASEDREKVYKYIIERFTPEKTSYIISFSTIQDRGCIDVLAGGLGYKDLAKVMEIKNKFEDYYSAYTKIVQEEVNTEELIENGEVEDSSISFDNYKVYDLHISNKDAKNKLSELKKQYDNLIQDNQDLFYYLNGLKGTIVAKGVHPSGIIGSPVTLADNIGLMYKDGDYNFPVSTCSMKAVDSLNYVKFDILGLKTVGIIKDTCKYANIPYPKSYNINWNDKNVWDNMIQAQQGVFQFESDYSFSLLKEFKPNTINHMSMVNASLRPSGKSYRDKLIAGIHNENPSKEIDELLASNNGFLIFQEDTIKFLTDICGFTGSDADTTRRAIGKKDKELLRKQLPKIIDGYCNNSPKEREIAKEEAKQFVQIIQDSSEYQFGLNHSTAYSMNGYECVWLRTYYPIEFITGYLNRADNNDDIINGIELSKMYNIKILPIKFGKSLSDYTIDKEHNTIYQGISSIKYCNSTIAEELMELSKNKKYNNFVDLLYDIKNTSVDSRQLKILIILNFFSDFGNNEYLLKVNDIFDKLNYAKIIKKSKIEELGIDECIVKKYSNKETATQYRELDNKRLILAICSKIKNNTLSIKEQIKAEMEYLGYTTYVNSDINENYYIVINYKCFKDATRPYMTLRNINNGEEIKTRITQSKIYKDNPFGEYSILKVEKEGFAEKFKKKCIGGEWTESDELELILECYEVII